MDIPYKGIFIVEIVMSIRSFQDKQVEILFRTGKLSSKNGWSAIKGVILRKLDMLNYAHVLNDLKSPPGNQLEKLKGDLKDWYSIRINDQWRIIFKWDVEPFDVKIVDYH